MNRRIFLALALATLSTLAGCSVVIGESFNGYTVKPSDASADSESDGAGASDASADSGSDGAPTTGNCTPACTGDHVVCDPADNKCKLDGTTSHVGDPCVSDGTCGSAPTVKCFDQGETTFAGGYCTMAIAMCSANVLCPVGASCATLGGGDTACYKNCDKATDCRSPDYECLNVDPLYVSGASNKVCYPKYFGCYSASNCPALKPTCTADGGLGFCTP